MIVILAVLFASILLTPSPDLVPVLDAFYDDGNATVAPTIAIIGWIFNNGTSVASCYLNYTINDSRGWSVSDSLNLGPIQPNGGYVLINQTYPWPRDYSGISITTPVQIVPEWTYKVTKY